MSLLQSQSCGLTDKVLIRFSSAAGALLGRITHSEKESCTLACLRDLLLPKLISGEILLRQAEKCCGGRGMTGTAENPDRLGRWAWERAGEGPGRDCKPEIDRQRNAVHMLKCSGAAT